MATALDRFTAKTDLSWKFRNDLAGASDPLDQGTHSHTVTLTEGEGANQAEVPYRDFGGSVAGAATNPVDLSGILTAAFGPAVLYTKIKYLLLINKGTAAADILRLESDATSGHIGIFKAKGAGIQIPPGGKFEWGGPSAAGAAVVAGTGDLLNIVNEGPTNAVGYDLFIVGCV